MAEEWKVQLSIKKGDLMLNIRADNAYEFKSLTDELAQMEELRSFFSDYAPASSKLVEAPVPPQSAQPAQSAQVAGAEATVAINKDEQAQTMAVGPVDDPVQAALAAARAKMAQRKVS